MIHVGWQPFRQQLAASLLRRRAISSLFYFHALDGAKLLYQVSLIALFKLFLTFPDLTAKN